MKALLIFPAILFATALHGVTVERISVPANGIQPRALTAADGTLHLVWFSGSDKGGDVWHATRLGGSKFGEPVRVNSVPGTAVAVGTIRGAQAALGKDGYVHVVWNGAWKRKGDRPPLYYTRSADGGKSFEPQRAMSGDWIMDGGGAVAADTKGNVHVFYHGGKGDGGGEAARRVMIRSSSDDGKDFGAERIISPDGLGVCGCCAMQAIATNDGSVAALYRTASDGGQNRDIAALISHDGGKTFASKVMDRWKISACPMSSMSLVFHDGKVVAAWEREGQISLGPLEGDLRLSPGGKSAQRKHPVLAVNGGDLLVAWTEGTGWQKGGTMSWQILGGSNLTPSKQSGGNGGVKVWSFVSVAPTKDGFVIAQ